MGQKDPRIDAYIAKAAPFARPILERLRALVHRGCPEVVETVKWSMPAFDYHGPFCSMAAFKEHAVFGFWRGELIVPGAKSMAAMGQFGRLTLAGRSAARRGAVGHDPQRCCAQRGRRQGPAAPQAREAPDPHARRLAAALKKNAEAGPPSRASRPATGAIPGVDHRAKTDATRKRRWPPP